MSLFNELKRRNVLRVGIAYVVAAWLLLQVIDFALDIIGAPNWIMQVLVLLGAVGLPAVLIFAWVFEMTPEGIKRESEIQSDESVTAHTARKLDKMTMAMLVAVVVLVIADRFLPDSGETSQPVAQDVSAPAIESVAEETPAPTIPSLAVLPFANMSADPDNEYFSDGISEELLNLLVQVDGLRVPSRTSSFAFKGMNMDIKEIARKLAVEHILEGSVRKAGNQVRITAQLIDVSTDTHLWSNTYDRELENIFAIQDEISREIVHELKIALDTSGLVSRDESRPTDDMQAYQDYLRGRHLFIQRGLPGLKASVAVLQSAVARDPEFADAWAALSQSAATLSGWDETKNAEQSNQIALEAGTRALELDKQSATAFAGLGILSYNLGNWPRALELMEKAANLSMDSTPTYFYGMILQACGYIAEAQEKLLLAETMDPVYPQLQYILGLNALARNELELARVHFQRSIDGGNSNGAFGMYYLALIKGNLDEATAYLDDIRVNTESELGGGYPEGHVDDVRAALKDVSLVENLINEGGNSLDFAILNYFGATTEIVHILTQLWADGDTLTVSITLGELWSPRYSDMRKTPEYKQFLTDIGMVDLWKKRGWPDLCHAVGENDFECN